jgi:kinesin family protein 11
MEKKDSTVPVVTTNTTNGEVTIVKGVGSRQHKTTFRFDRVFGSFTTQEEIYEETLLPVIDDVLRGYESTVFAYGQTGTGKTFTMEGDLSEGIMGGAGIIPRASQSIFDRCSNEKVYESFSVVVSFLEVYNEEMSDLLSDVKEHDGPPSPRKKSAGKAKDKEEKGVKLMIVEDKPSESELRKRPKGQCLGVYVKGLKEIECKTPDDVLRLLRKAQEKRHTAETKMNKASSRSHCLFTMKVYTKELTTDGMVMERQGKLHMADLAGSENAKAAGTGASRTQLRESMNINQSLLTLGRVITALKEKSSRVPYRDSKLTRILQESLGGRCKTVIIATVTPSILSTEETLSTLSYAQRAVGIQNKPITTMKMTRRPDMAGADGEIGMLRSALDGKQSTQGVELATFREMEFRLEYMEAQVQEAQAALARKHDLQMQAQAALGTLEHERDEALDELRQASERLDELIEEMRLVEEELERKRVECEEKKRIITARTQTEGSLHNEAGALLSIADLSVAEGERMHVDLTGWTTRETEKRKETRGFCEEMNARVEGLEMRMRAFAREQGVQLEAHHEIAEVGAADSRNAAAAMVRRGRTLRLALREARAEVHKKVVVSMDTVQAALTKAAEEQGAQGDEVREAASQGASATEAALDRMAEAGGRSTAQLDAWSTEAQRIAEAQSASATGVMMDELLPPLEAMRQSTAAMLEMHVSTHHESAAQLEQAVTTLRSGGAGDEGAEGGSLNDVRGKLASTSQLVQAGVGAAKGSVEGAILQLDESANQQRALAAAAGNGTAEAVAVAAATTATAPVAIKEAADTIRSWAAVQRAALQSHGQGLRRASAQLGVVSSTSSGGEEGGAAGVGALLTKMEAARAAVAEGVGVARDGARQQQAELGSLVGEGRGQEAEGAERDPGGLLGQAKAEGERADEALVQLHQTHSDAAAQLVSSMEERLGSLRDSAKAEQTQAAQVLAEVEKALGASKEAVVTAVEEQGVALGRQQEQLKQAAEERQQLETHEKATTNGLNGTEEALGEGVRAHVLAVGPGDEGCSGQLASLVREGGEFDCLSQAEQDQLKATRALSNGVADGVRAHLDALSCQRASTQAAAEETKEALSYEPRHLTAVDVAQEGAAASTARAFSAMTTQQEKLGTCAGVQAEAAAKTAKQDTTLRSFVEEACGGAASTPEQLAAQMAGGEVGSGGGQVAAQMALLHEQGRRLRDVRELCEGSASVSGGAGSTVGGWRWAEREQQLAVARLQWVGNSNLAAHSHALDTHRADLEALKGACERGAWVGAKDGDSGDLERVVGESTAAVEAGGVEGLAGLQAQVAQLQALLAAQKEGRCDTKALSELNSGVSLMRTAAEGSRESAEGLQAKLEALATRYEQGSGGGERKDAAVAHASTIEAAKEALVSDTTAAHAQLGEAEAGLESAKESLSANAEGCELELRTALAAVRAAVTGGGAASGSDSGEDGAADSAAGKQVQAALEEHRAALGSAKTQQRQGNGLDAQLEALSSAEELVKKAAAEELAAFGRQRAELQAMGAAQKQGDKREELLQVLEAARTVVTEGAAAQLEAARKQKAALAEVLVAQQKGHAEAVGAVVAGVEALLKKHLAESERGVSLAVELLMQGTTAQEERVEASSKQHGVQSAKAVTSTEAWGELGIATRAGLQKLVSTTDEASARVERLASQYKLQSSKLNEGAKAWGKSTEAVGAALEQVEAQLGRSSVQLAGACARLEAGADAADEQRQQWATASAQGAQDFAKAASRSRDTSAQLRRLRQTCEGMLVEAASEVEVLAAADKATAQEVEVVRTLVAEGTSALQKALGAAGGAEDSEDVMESLRRCEQQVREWATAADRDATGLHEAQLKAEAGASGAEAFNTKMRSQFGSLGGQAKVWVSKGRTVVSSIENLRQGNGRNAGHIQACRAELNKEASAIVDATKSWAKVGKKVAEQAAKMELSNSDSEQAARALGGQIERRVAEAVELNKDWEALAQTAATSVDEMAKVNKRALEALKKDEVELTKRIGACAAEAKGWAEADRRVAKTIAKIEQANTESAAELSRCKEQAVTHAEAAADAANGWGEQGRRVQARVRSVAVESRAAVERLEECERGVRAQLTGLRRGPVVEWAEQGRSLGRKLGALQEGTSDAIARSASVVQVAVDQHAEVETCLKQAVGLVDSVKASISRELTAGQQLADQAKLKHGATTEAHEALRGTLRTWSAKETEAAHGVVKVARTTEEQLRALEAATKLYGTAAEVAETQARSLGESVSSMSKQLAQLAGGIDGVIVGEGDCESGGGTGGVIGSVASLETNVAGNIGTDSSGGASSTTSTGKSMLGRAANAVGELADGCARGAERTVILRAQLAQAAEALTQLGGQYSTQEKEVGERLSGWERAAEGAAAAVADVGAEQRECMLRMVAAKQQAGYTPEGGEGAGAGCYDEHATKASKKARQWCEAQAAATADLVRRIGGLKGLAAAGRREQEQGVAATKTEARGCARAVGEGVGQQLQALQVTLQATTSRCRECVAEHKIECCADPAEDTTAGGAIGTVVESYLEDEGKEAESATAKATSTLHEFEAQRRDQVSGRERVRKSVREGVLEEFALGTVHGREWRTVRSCSCTTHRIIVPTDSPAGAAQQRALRRRQGYWNVYQELRQWCPPHGRGRG